MRCLSLRARASLLLATTLLPLSALAQTPAPSPTPSSEPIMATAPAPSGDSSMGPNAEQPADLPPARGHTKLDIGVSAGFNSPAGIYGAEIEYRALPWLGLNVSGGAGAWGLRVGPLVRLYPLGERGFSPFVEGGASFNLGSEVWSEVNGERRYADQLFTPVAIASVGARIALGSRLFLTPRVGWAFRLREDNFRMRDGNPPDSLTETAVILTQHGGFLTSLSFGVAIF